MGIWFLILVFIVALIGGRDSGSRFEDGLSFICFITAYILLLVACIPRRRNRKDPKS